MEEAAAAPLPAAAESTSDFVILPAGPLPDDAPEVDALGGRHARRDGGHLRARRSLGGLAPAPAPSTPARRRGCVGSAPARLLPARSASAAAFSEIRAITWPTVTVSPSAMRISLTVPVAGEGSSMSTLSVEISTIVSSSLIGSPTFTRHSRIVPSDTDSPAAGVTTSTVSACPVGAGSSRLAGGGAVGLLPAAWICGSPRPARALRGASSAGASGGVAGERSAGAAPFSEMRAITWPTVTVSPSSMRISLTVPVAGEGSSMSTLSVEISTIVSSTLIGSPTFTCHSRMVPSETDSPAAGVTTSTVC